MSVAAGTDIASCEYCGARSRVSQRTRFLERPVAPQRADDLPVAVQRHSRKWIVTMILFYVGLGALGVIVPLALRGGSRSDFWGGNHPMLADANGDGALDIIGLIRQIPGDDSTRMVAFDGKTGKELWRGPVLGVFRDIQEGRLGTAGGVILFAQASGNLAGFDVRTGTQLWTGTALGEKAKRMCAGPDGTVFIDLADEQRVPIQLADGSKGAAEDGKRPCEPIWSLTANAQPDTRVSRWPFYDRTPHPDSLGENMRVEWTLQMGSGPVIALGAKRKGTAVPELGAYAPLPEVDPDSRPSTVTVEPLWLTEVPAKNPLDAKSGAPDHAAIGDGAVVVGYSTKGDVLKIAAFELESGVRRWEVSVPEPAHGSNVLAGLAVADGLVWVSTWTALHVMDAKTGGPRFRVGR